MLWKIGISALLLTLSYPVVDLEFLAWFAFIPFFYALNNKSRAYAFKYGFFFGLLFFSLTIYWLHYVSILGYLLLVSCLALFFGIFAFLIRYRIYDMRFLNIIIIPFIWVLLEYVRTYLFSGFGWALLGYSQYRNLILIQIADKVGVWGVSFVIMMVNVVIFKLLKNGLKTAKSTLLFAIIILACSFSYGYVRLNEESRGKDLTVSVIQGNIPQEEKWPERFRERNMTRYENLTKEAISEKPDLIIWPETALPGYLEENDLKMRVAGLAKGSGIPILIGAPSLSVRRNGAVYNSAALISEKGIISARYDKLHLVPFGEYIPFEKRFSFIRRLIDKPIGDFTRGAEYTIFHLEDGVRFGVLICFEDIFPGLVRDFVKKGAGFLVNITNDAWFMDSSAPYQHAQASVFRAVENRVPVIRAANTGLSCFIDSKGRIIDRVKVGKKDISVAGFKTSRINIPIK